MFAFMWLAAILMYWNDTRVNVHKNRVQFAGAKVGTLEWLLWRHVKVLCCSTQADFMTPVFFFFKYLLCWLYYVKIVHRAVVIIVLWSLRNFNKWYALIRSVKKLKFQSISLSSDLRQAESLNVSGRQLNSFCSLQ